MKLWLVSGDNEESTIASAYASKLFNPNLQVVNIKNTHSEYACAKILQRAITTHIYKDGGAISRWISEKEINPDKELENNKINLIEDSLVSEYLEEASLIRNEISKGPTIAYQELLTNTNTKRLSPSDDFLSKSFFPNSINYAVSIDRKSFETALNSAESRKMLISLLFAAKVVCFHDMLPKDKAVLVKLLKELVFKPAVLAIGEGNSNIAMIQEADVGIGIRGKQHNQSKNFCEITLTHFSQLSDLLLLHGHWNYSRMSRIILLFFYKNFILTTITFGYVFLSDYSGATIFDSGLLVGYNLLYTTLPLFVIGIFDQDIDRLKIFENPHIYTQGIMNKLFSYKSLIYYSAQAIIQGFLLLLLIGGNYMVALSENGDPVDRSLFGTVVYISTVIVALSQI